MSDHDTDESPEAAAGRASAGSAASLLRAADQPRHGSIAELTRRRWASSSLRLGGLVLVLGALTALVVGVAVVVLAIVVLAAAS